MNTIKSYLVCSIAVVTASILVAACHRAPSYHNGTTPSMACASNPYLMKYNCSIRRIEQAAENGNPDAQYALGYMYYYGINTIRDRQTAELWIQRSAKQGQPLAKKAWSLINTGTTFTDLHQKATDQLTAESQASNTIAQQEPVDVDKMNATTPTQPINQILPAYHSDTSNNTSESAEPHNAKPIHDPRLSSNTKPIVAAAATTSSDVAKKYTVQLMASNRLSDVKAFIAVHQLGAKVSYFETTLNGKPWYMLTYGRYDTEQQAETALQNMPTNLLRHHPWVKSFAIVEEEVRLQKVIA